MAHHHLPASSAWQSVCEHKQSMHDWAASQEVSVNLFHTSELKCCLRSTSTASSSRLRCTPKHAFNADSSVLTFSSWCKGPSAHHSSEACALIERFDRACRSHGASETPKWELLQSLSYCAEDNRTVQKFLCKKYAQQNKLGSLLCTAILGFSSNLG